MAKTFFTQLLVPSLAFVATQNIVVADTWTDITNANITLTEGQWEVKLEGTFVISNTSGGTANTYPNIQISDLNNNLLDNSMAVSSSSTLASQSTATYLTLLAKVTVNPGSTLGVKARARYSLAGAAGSMAIPSLDLTGSLTGNDTGLKFYARRVG